MSLFHAPDWQPENYDKTFHGMVQLRTALAQSYNAATARLGTDIGVDPRWPTICGRCAGALGEIGFPPFDEEDPA